MNISFNKTGDKLLLEYAPDNGCEWIADIFSANKPIIIKRAFTFTKDDVEDLNSDNDETRTFVIGLKNSEGYYEIKKEILGIKNSLFIFEDTDITPRTFLSTPDTISIFKIIDNLVSESMYIGGKKTNAIPISEFNKLLSLFPTKTEIYHYSSSRIQRILEEYFDTMTDSQKKLDKYIQNKAQLRYTPELECVKEFELQKYVFIRDRIIEMLKKSDSYSEKDWEKRILEFILVLYPKYVHVLHSVLIEDAYTNPQKTTKRQLDLGLLDANGHLDIIEIKKPFSSCVLSTTTYRDNYIPKKELSGTIVQAEKYIFYLNKWGTAGEKELNNRYQKELPSGLEIKIVNPQALIILGRSDNFNNAQKMDFEIIRRKYANIMDIITYDDLLDRLNRIISKFS